MKANDILMVLPCFRNMKPGTYRITAQDPSTKIRPPDRGAPVRLFSQARNNIGFTKAKPAPKLPSSVASPFGEMFANDMDSSALSTSAQIAKIRVPKAGK